MAMIYNVDDGAMTAKQSNYGFGLTYDPTGKAPIIAHRVWDTYDHMMTWINNPDKTAIVGLILTVNEDSDASKNGAYMVTKIKASSDDTDGTVVKLATGGDADAIANEVNNILSQLGTNSGDTSITNYVSGDTFSGVTVVDMLDNLSDGLENAVSGISYASATNRLTVKHLSGSTDIQLTGVNLISSVTYDKTTEKLTIAYVKMGESSASTVSIDLSDLIHETVGASGVTNVTAEVSDEGRLNVISGVVATDKTDKYLKVGAEGFYTSGITEDFALKQNIILGGDFETTVYPTEFSAATPIATANTVSSAFTKVEHTISALTTEILKNELVVEKALETFKDSAGFYNNGLYVAPQTYYISGSTDVTNALYLLANEIAAVASEAGAAVTEITDDDKAIEVTNSGTVYNVKLNIDDDSADMLSQSADGLAISDTWDCGTY